MIDASELDRAATVLRKHARNPDSLILRAICRWLRKSARQLRAAAESGDRDVAA